MDATTLKRRHDDAESRASLYAFLLDAWDGTGGFAPPLDEVVSANTYGPENDILPDWKGTSYIDRFSRESVEKWRNRVRRAHYTNIFRTIGETICGFLFRRVPSRLGGDEFTDAFLSDADGKGTTWDDMLRHEIGRRVWTFGALPILVDRPVDDSDNQADRQDTYVRVLSPASLYDWETDDDGALLWAKIVELVTSCESASDERETIWRATEWTRDGWQRWTLTEGDDIAKDGGSGTHPCGCVPIVLASMSRPIGSSILGTSAAHEIAQEARKLYNYQSLLDEHLYGQVYAVLQVTLGELSREAQGGFKLGTDNALVLQQGGSASFIAPPQSVSDTLFKAIDQSVRRAFRAARLEFTLRESGQPESGVSRQYEFAATDRGIKAFADEMARVEVETQRLVALWDGRDPDSTLAEYKVEYPESYDVKDLDRELTNIEKALAMQLGPTAERRLRMQARDDLITLEGQDLEDSDKEINEAQEIAAEAATVGRDANGNPVVAMAAVDLLTDTDKAAVVTVNEARVQMGLGPLMRPDGTRDPDGDLTVEDFRAKREALRSAQAGAGVVAAKLVAPEAGKAEGKVIEGKPKPRPINPFFAKGKQPMPPEEVTGGETAETPGD